MSFSPHRMISIVKYVIVHLTNIRCSSVTYVTQDGICTAFSHPLPPSRMEPRNVPNASRATSYPRQKHSTFAFLSQFSISTLIKILQKKMTLINILQKICLAITNPHFRSTHYHSTKQKKCTSKHSHTPIHYMLTYSCGVRV